MNMIIESQDKVVFTVGEYTITESPEGYLIGRPANGVVEVMVHTHGPIDRLGSGALLKKMTLAIHIATDMASEINDPDQKYGGCGRVYGPEKPEKHSGGGG